jgi:WD40 repeat protein
MNFQELGGDYFVRALQDFTRSSERKIADLKFEKSELEVRVQQLEATLEAKDRVIREYLRRVALLEFALRRVDKQGLVRGTWKPYPQTFTPPPVVEQKSTKEMIKAFLDELDGDLQMPDISESDLVVRTEPESPTDDIGEWKSCSVLRTSLGAARAVCLPHWRGMDCLVTGGDEGVVKIWSTNVENIPSDVEVKNVSLNQNSVTSHFSLRRTGFGITSLAVSGSDLLTADSGGNMTIWSVCDSLKKSELFPSTTDLNRAIRAEHCFDKVHEGRINGICFDSGQFIASVGNDSSLVIRGLKEGAAHHFVKSASVASSVVAMGTQAVTSHLEGSLRFYDIETGKLISESPQGNSITATAIVDSLVCLAQTDGTIGILDPRSQNLVHAKLNFVPTCLAGSAPRLAVGGLDGSVAIFDMRNLTEPARHRWDDAHAVARAEGTIAVAFSENGNLLTSAGADGKVRFFKKL